MRDALSLFDQVLSFSGSSVRDEDLVALLGLIDRELLLDAPRARSWRATAWPCSSSSRGWPTTAPTTATSLRELLLHLPRAAAGEARSPGRARSWPASCPRSAARLRRAGRAPTRRRTCCASSTLLTKAEIDAAQRPRTRGSRSSWRCSKLVAAAAAACRSVELVARVERLLGGAPGGGAAPPAPPRALPSRVRTPRRPLPSPPAAAAASGVRHGRPSRSRDPPASAARQASPPPGAAEALLAAMLEPLPGAALARRSRSRAATRPLRRRDARARGAARLRDAAPSAHADDYQRARGEGRRQARPAHGSQVKAEPPRRLRRSPRSPEVAKQSSGCARRRSSEPAVQEALDLFDGRVVDVREAKPGREDA